MIEYKYNKKENKFTENGHTMFEEDVLKRLKRLSYLEEQIKQSKLHQPTVISAVCCCGIADIERQNVERNLNECIICGRIIKQTDL